MIVGREDRQTSVPKVLWISAYDTPNSLASLPEEPVPLESPGVWARDGYGYCRTATTSQHSPFRLVVCIIIPPKPVPPVLVVVHRGSPSNSSHLSRECPHLRPRCPVVLSTKLMYA